MSSDMFGGAPPPPPPAAPKRPRRPAGHAGAAQKSRPAAELQVVQEQQPEPQAPTPPPEKINTVGRQYGPKTLHDCRQVGSGSEEWRRECLARYLLDLPPRERDDWLQSLKGDMYFAADMRQVMNDLRATDRVGD